MSLFRLKRRKAASKPQMFFIQGKRGKMPKLKSKSAVKKRFSLTASGKVKGTQAFKRHNLMCKSQKMKRNARGRSVMGCVVAKIIKKYLG